MVKVSYRARQSMTHQAIIKMIAVWVLAFVLYGPAIIFWELVVGRSRVPKDECFAEFYYSCIRRRRNHHREAQLQHQLQASEPASAQGEGIPLSHNWGFGIKLPGRGSIHSQTSSPCLGKLDPSTSRAAQPSRLSRDKKIAKSLAIIVCVFAICWAPYTLLMIIRAACRGRCIQHHCSFRRAFSKILCPKRYTTPPSSVLRPGQ
ncbi:hypothetical protein AMECASPLE_017770 [Ameca splendens]|uniref:G-protein coupled receptors family 1 profile domain-containing protein n=1 Tax=Ameca splendens TaxID=208324 RepID=A0ABV0YEI3_9TELE